MDIVRVAEKLKAFRRDFPAGEYAIDQDFEEDVVGSTSRVTGICKIVHVATGNLIAGTKGTRALREPIPGAQGHHDTRDPDRAMTQALGRALGTLGYADADGIEGDTDEPDQSRSTRAAAPPPIPVNPATLAKAKLRGEPVDLIDSSGLKTVLNDLDDDSRKKVRAALKAAGLPTTLPTSMPPEMFDRVEALIDNLDGPS
jgi:hypothetical protein